MGRKLSMPPVFAIFVYLNAQLCRTCDTHRLQRCHTLSEADTIIFNFVLLDGTQGHSCVAVRMLWVAKVDRPNVGVVPP